MRGVSHPDVWDEQRKGKNGDVMAWIEAAVTLAVAGYFMFTITRHIVRPADNAEYTRMLMFVGMATIPLVFLVGFAGGRDRWPRLIEYAVEIAGENVWTPLAVAGLGAVVIVLPLAIFAAVWIMMGMRSGMIFTLYFVPLFLRMAFETADSCVKHSVLQVGLFFIAVFIAMGVVAVLRRLNVGMEPYVQQVRAVWQDYDRESSINMFFWVCSFALLNQLVEFLRALLALLT